jgi:hypothetical protein
MSSGATKVLAIMVTGNSRPYMAATASGLGSTSPSQIPTRMQANRSRSSPTAARACPSPA